MPAPRLAVLTIVVATSACADRDLAAGGDDAAADEFLPPSPRFDVFDYGTCSLGAVVADCEGVACAEDGTEALYELFVETVEEHWLADYVDVSRTYFQIGQRVDWVEFQVHVGWARSSHSLGFPTENEAERRELILAKLDELEVPLTLADPDVVAEAVNECLMVEFDPCLDLESPALVSRQIPSNPFGLRNWIVHVDTKTGSTLYCGPVDVGD